LLSVQEPVTRSYRNILFTKDGYKQVSAYGASPQLEVQEPVTRSYRNILFTKDGYKQVSAYGASPQLECWNDGILE
jgi:phage-related protein